MTRSKHLFIGLAMLVAAGLALALTPREKVADQGPKMDLEAMIPKQFGDWRVADSLAPLMVSPDVKAALNRIYSQTLSRIYVDQAGERMMLSIAYGGDQSDSMRVHKPEVCYPSQGFAVEKLTTGTLDTGFHPIPVRRLVAVRDNRVEPVTYWILLGDVAVANTTIRKLEMLKYGLTGRIPDGLLFRVSSISPDENQAFTEQAGFIDELLKNVSPQVRARLIGNSS
jgi:EpsI family protein